MSYITAILDSSCNRRSFTCGVKMLDDYFQNQVNQDMKRKLAVCFVMTEFSESKTTMGFYTLSNSSIPQ